MRTTGTSARMALRPPTIRESPADGKSSSADLQPRSPAHLDGLDRALIELLLKDGKITNRELSLRTNISESAVGTRLRKLATSGTVAFSAVIDWETVGFEWLVIARVKTCARSPGEVAEDVAALGQCVQAAVTLGSHDVVAHFLVTDRTELRKLTSEGLPAIEGISSIDIDVATETTVTPNGQKGFIAKCPPAIPLPAPKIELDDLDVAILQELIDDGRQSSRKIARSHHVSEGTVRARVNRLTQAGLVRVVAMVHPSALGLGGAIANVAMRIDRSRIEDIKAQLEAMPELLFVATCVGSVDVSFVATATNTQHLIELVSRQVQTIEGVRSTDILIMVDMVLASPYMKRFDTTG